MSANLRIPDEVGIFPDEMCQEIIEPYDDDYEVYELFNVFPAPQVLHNKFMTMETNQ